MRRISLRTALAALAVMLPLNVQAEVCRSTPPPDTYTCYYWPPGPFGGALQCNIYSNGSVDCCQEWGYSAYWAAGCLAV